MIFKKNSSKTDRKSTHITGEREQVHLLKEICIIWETARSNASHSVNTSHVQANWLIGRQIVEFLQKGKKRAEYGTQLLPYLSENLSVESGSGFSVSSLKYMRIFYMTYPDLMNSIGHPPGDQSHSTSTLDTWVPGKLHPNLSWRHYRALLKVDTVEARNFYEIETLKNNWSARQLERQIDSLLFFRLAKSRNKKGILALAKTGDEITNPVDILKDPFVLEFVDIPESSKLNETQLETALITKLKDFLLELGSGFAYVGRQKRLTLDGDDFYSDLIFYHIRLKCYVVIDLKTAKLTHGDLGQMLMYVNYFDREIKTKNENPTIGLILCTDKNSAMAEYVLGEKQKQIFTSRYQHVLPTVEELTQELHKEMERLSLPLKKGKTHPKRKRGSL